MDPLGDPLTTRPILKGWEFTMEPYPSGQFGFIDHLDRQFGNGSVWTQTWTRRDGPEPLLTLSTSYTKYCTHRVLHTLSTGYTEYCIHRGLDTPSAAYTESCIFPRSTVSRSQAVSHLSADLTVLNSAHTITR
jgi:hypothetical protein